MYYWANSTSGCCMPAQICLAEIKECNSSVVYLANYVNKGSNIWRISDHAYFLFPWNYVYFAEGKTPTVIWQQPWLKQEVSENFKDLSIKCRSKRWEKHETEQSSKLPWRLYVRLSLYWNVLLLGCLNCWFCCCFRQVLRSRTVGQLDTVEYLDLSNLGLGKKTRCYHYDNMAVFICFVVLVLWSRT